jgi:hypothetical protein
MLEQPAEADLLEIGAIANDPGVIDAPLVVDLAEVDAPVFLQQVKLSTEATIALAIANFVTPAGFVR